MKNDNLSLDHDNGIDVDNDEELPLMGDIDSGDHDQNDLNGRPRKIRR